MNVVVIDGLNLIRRVHAAVSSAAGGSDDASVSRSCVGSLRRILARQRPSHALCVMDTEGPSRQHREFVDYKANRKPMDAALKALLPRILEAFEAEGVGSLAVEGFEADDVIATIAARVGQAGGNVTIVSTDKLLCQLVTGRVRIYDHFSNRYMDRQAVTRRFDVPPESLATLFGLAGDASLNITGVRAVGVHTAARLIHELGTLDAILAAAADMRGHLGAKLRAGADDARLALRLLTLRTDVDVGVNLKDFRLARRPPPAG